MRFLFCLFLIIFPFCVYSYQFKDDNVYKHCQTLSEDGKELLNKLEIVEEKFNISIVVTSGDRTWGEQLWLILRRQSSYGICREFKRNFNLESIPQESNALTSGQLEWWRNTILEGSGSRFPHVGGSAIDIRVFNLSVKQREMIKTALEELGVKIILEAPPKYNVPIESATVFHLCKAEEKE